jgi:hypothetical protein
MLKKAATPVAAFLFATFSHFVVPANAGTHTPRLLV